jgi:hypothetical protein
MARAPIAAGFKRHARWCVLNDNPEVALIELREWKQ